MTSYQQKLADGDFFRAVCVGDAVTSQSPVKPSWSDWLQRAFWEMIEPQKAWRRQVINTAYSRATVRHVATYITHYVTQFKPDVIILSFGATPLFPTYEEATFISELDMILSALKKANIPVIGWSPYPFSGGIARDGIFSLERIYQQKMQENGGIYVDVVHEFDNIELSKIFTVIAAEKSELFGLQPGSLDHIHPNEIGQYVIARKIAEVGFQMGLPTSSTGSFEVPNLELVKKWQ